MKRPAPWTLDQVESLKGYQSCGFFHPFTWGSDTPLEPTTKGWVRDPDGQVIQDWALGYMLDWSWQNHPLFQGTHAKPSIEEVLSSRQWVLGEASDRAALKCELLYTRSSSASVDVLLDLLDKLDTIYSLSMPLH
jgi:hypothetical protein